MAKLSHASTILHNPDKKSKKREMFALPKKLSKKDLQTSNRNER